MNRKFGWRVLTIVIALLSLSGCGYRLANKNFGGGEGRTIAVPTFKNSSTT